MCIRDRLNVVVKHGRKQIVGRADRMKIARKMQIDVLHGNDLGVSAAGCTALDAEHRTKMCIRDSSFLRSSANAETLFIIA